MGNGKTGRIVWHDLFTRDRPRSMDFYERLATWRYLTEHATDFTWGGGEKDFVLALSNEEVGAGFAETPTQHEDGWIAYVEVDDVDLRASLAEKLGGTIVRPPFDVPGVGRNCLLRDPLGALLGISISRHSYPVQRRQFGPERYLSHPSSFPEDFYSEMFGWITEGKGLASREAFIALPSGYQVAVAPGESIQWDRPPCWAPSIVVTDPDASVRDVEMLGGAQVALGTRGPGDAQQALLRDPNGALFFVVRSIG